jgi:DNA polymerase III alpha subunit (gram-positive type)
MKIKALRLVREDGKAFVCHYCEGKDKAIQYAETNGLDLTLGVCPDCKKKYRMDSLGSPWLLPC